MNTCFNDPFNHRFPLLIKVAAATFRRPLSRISVSGLRCRCFGHRISKFPALERWDFNISGSGNSGFQDFQLRSVGISINSGLGGLVYLISPLPDPATIFTRCLGERHCLLRTELLNIGPVYFHNPDKIQNYMF